MSETCLLLLGTPDTSPDSESHAENQSSGQTGMGAGPGGAKCEGSRRRNGKSMVGAGGSGEDLCRRSTG